MDICDAFYVIRAASHEQTVLHEVDQVLENLIRVTESSKIPTSRKIEVLSNTVTRVIGAMVTKMKEGVVSGEEVGNVTEKLLDEHVNQIMESTSPADSELIQDTTELIGIIAETIIAKLDEDEVKGKLADGFSLSALSLLDVSSNVEGSDNNTITDVDAQISLVNHIVESIIHKLGKTLIYSISTKKSLSRFNVTKT